MIWRVLLLLAILPAGVTVAHDPLSSSARLDVREGTLHLEVVMAPHAAVLLLGDDDVPQVTTRPDEARFQAEFRRPLQAVANDVCRISIDGIALVPTAANVTLTDDRDVLFHVEFPFPQGDVLRCEATYLASMTPDHMATIKIYGSSTQALLWQFLDPADNWVELPASDLAATAESAEATRSPGTEARSTESHTVIAPSILKLLRLGIEHILIGYDHLLFLAGLLIVCERFSSIVKIVTCFTVAHSLTLALSALDLVNVTSESIEPAIAASIVYVGLENLIRRDEPPDRWRTTFLFGLIHGFGFAGVFRELTGGGSLVAPLFAFNLGVEVGQMAVIAVFLPVLWLLRRNAAFTRYGLPALSLAVAVMGAYWFVERVFQ